MNTLEALKKARELISEPFRWTKGAYARDSHETKVLIHSAEAVCFCSLGAIRKVAGGEYDNACIYLERMVPYPYRLVSHFNDDPRVTHTDVLALFDKAIRELEK